MPKLAKKMAAKTDKAKPVNGGFEPLPPGKYIATLSKCEAKLSSAGNPMWSIEFDNIVNLDGEKQPGRQFYNLNLPTTDDAPANYTANGKVAAGSAEAQTKWEQYQGLCHGRLKAFFEAFGYDADSDTDEMIGEQIIIQLGIGTINKGPKMGQSTNQVNGLFTLDSVDGAAEAASGEADPDDF